MSVLGLVGFSGIVGVGGGSVVFDWVVQQFRLEEDWSSAAVVRWCLILFLVRPMTLVISAILNCLRFELWISLDPLLSRPRLILMYWCYCGPSFSSRCLRSTFRMLWFFLISILESVCPMSL
ncbi:hypothetical protein RHMOL_Rhmol10G0053800 [Rhododendron molle]|uniref:Uncharacterized protein n=1 Tax=Rhododendron molle TaxID=49168 RepID=A0ACC0M061_RHOML|nr:hypothetical protein RHMOL_Rhmol10G0053800 [Rhododendron molle]